MSFQELSLLIVLSPFQWWYGKRGRVILLCNTDYKVLLSDCRELSEMVETGKLEPGKYNVRVKPNPNISIFPKTLLNIHPTYIYIDENGSGYVQVEMLGGLDHFGIIAYPKDFKKPWSNFVFGNRELIPGLWYYDDGYEVSPEEYENKIEALIKKNRAF